MINNKKNNKNLNKNKNLKILHKIQTNKHPQINNKKAKPYKTTPKINKNNNNKTSKTLLTKPINNLTIQSQTYKMSQKNLKTKMATTLYKILKNPNNVTPNNSANQLQAPLYTLFKV